jgi:hypothetical protein
MPRFDDTPIGVIEKTLDEKKQTKLGTVTLVREKIVDEEPNLAVNVAINGRDSEERLVAVADTADDTIDVPRVGDTVLLEYLSDESDRPVVTQVFDTRDRPSLISRAGMHKERYPSRLSGAGDGDIYVTKYTQYFDDNGGPELVDPDDLVPKQSIFQIAKRETDVADPFSAAPANAKVEFYDNTETGDAYVEIAFTKVGGVDADTTWGLKFDIRTGEFKLVDASGYGIVSDGAGNFTWENQSINKVTSFNGGSLSL